MLRAGHDGYAGRCGVVHQRILTLASDGTRLEGEELFLAADGSAQIRAGEDAYAVRFHLHPLTKATRLTDGHGVLLVMPNKEVWTFSVAELQVEIEDSVYLAGTDGPRRTSQMVIHGNARRAPRVVWTFRQTNQASVPAPTASRLLRSEEPKLQL